MAGYTPVFSSIFDGTLHGKWPQTGVWLALLAMTDRHGCIDRTPQAIASDIGIAVGDLIVCIDEFMQPDPMSRTRDCDGRRLVLIDENRPWGWRVVNHGRYREKARLQAKDSARTESGADAARKRTSPEVPRSPPPPPSPDSDSDSDSDKNKNKTKTPPAIAGTPPEGNASRKRSATATRLPADFELTQSRRETATKEGVDADREFLKFADYWRSASGATARKHDWDATWRNWCRKAQDMRPRQNGAARRVYRDAPTTEQLEALEADRAGK